MERSEVLESLQKRAGPEKTKRFSDVIQILADDIVEEALLRESLKHAHESLDDDAYKRITYLNGALDRCIKRIHSGMKLIDIQPADSKLGEDTSFDKGLADLVAEVKNGQHGNG